MLTASVAMFILNSIAVPMDGGKAALPSLVPKPAHVRMATGQFQFTSQTRIATTDATRSLGHYLRAELGVPMKFPLEITRRPVNPCVSLIVDRRLEVLGEEGYRLKIRPEGIEIRGGGEAGVFYGIQTLRQLLPLENFRRAPVANARWTVPALDIEDKPRFSWRGLHLDVARHFIPKRDILRLLDLMALHKLNTFHWHLTDDQGWRLQIRHYPRLTEVGAFRTDTMLTYDPPTFTGKPHGGYYTQDDVREVVAYAAERQITVVPEIEMPGHAQAAIAAYPHLGNRGENLPVFTRWGVNENVFNVEDSTIEFLQNVLAEVLELFPSKFIHIGGDECPKGQWKESPKAQAKMKALELENEEALQSWFICQMDAWLTQRGRRLVGWDEILEGGLAKGATVMSWRGMRGGIAAAKAGHDVVMTPTSHTYFDYYQSEDREREPHAIGGYVPLEKVYEFEPVPKELDAKEARHILGGQAQLWTEYIRDYPHAEYMAFPRACALSEVLWSSRDNRKFDEFLPRLKSHLRRLAVLDVNYRKP
jgi:hexosaminidase